MVLGVEKQSYLNTTKWHNDKRLLSVEIGFVN